jgi:O-antigen ligase
MRPLTPPIQNSAGALLVALAFAIPVSNALTSVLTAVFVAVMALGQMVGSWRGRWSRVLRHPAVMASLALYGSVLLASLWTVAPQAGAGGQLVRNASLLLLPLFAVVLQEGPWTRRCLLAFSVAMGMTLVLSFAHALWLAAGVGTWVLPYKGGGDAIFHVHITHNVLMSVAVLVWLGWALVDRSLRPAQRWAWGGLALLAVFNILWMVPGRTGYLTLLAALLIVALVRCPRRWLAPCVLGIIALGATALWMSDSAQERLDRTWREIQAFEGADSTQRGDVNLADHRLAIWREAWKVIQHSPLLGNGTGSYRAAFCASAQPADMCLYGGGKHPHNQFLFVAIEGGVLGVACYAAWVLALGYGLWRRRGEGPLGAIGPGLWVVWMIYGMVDTPLQLLTERHFFPLFFALLLFAPIAPRGVNQDTVPR